MIDELKPYPEYRESTLAAMGNIPAHWNELRAKYLYREVDERSATGEEVLCSVSHKTGVTPRMASVTMFLAESTVGHKICRPNDVVINTLWAWMAALGVAKQIGLVSPAYGVYRPLADSQLLPAFADQILRTPPYKREYMARSTGVNASRLRLYPESFLRIPILFPPPAEQAGIVRFLGAVDRKVNRFIRAKRRLIEVLTEQKQAIITHAVTRGLNPPNPAAPLKPSGIDWLGDVPAQWDVQRLKWLAHIKTGGRDTVHRKDDGAYPFFVRSQTVERIDTYCFDGEAVLTAGDGAGVAKVFHYVNEKFDYHQRVYKFSDFRRVRGKFFFHYFSVTLRFEAFRETAKSTVDSLRLPMLQDFPVPIPPLDEQDAIVAYVEEQTSGINKSISLIRREIDLIREYRTRLVADVVTGKVDVRAAAAAIPNDSELTPLQPGSDEIVADDDLSEDALEDESGVGVAADGEDEA